MDIAPWASGSRFTALCTWASAHMRIGYGRVVTRRCNQRPASSAY